MKRVILVAALLFPPASQAGTWDYEPWRLLDSDSRQAGALGRASLSTVQAGVGFEISLERGGQGHPVWRVTVSTADRIVGLNSIRALNPDSVMDDQVEILESGHLQEPGNNKSRGSALSATISPDGMSSIRHSTRVEIGVGIYKAVGCAACPSTTTYTIDTSDLGLAFVDFDMDARKLQDIDVSRAYLMEFDRRHEPLDTIPQDLWMITPAEVERHREQLGLSHDEILAMSQYDIQDALYDKADQEFQDRQAAQAARDAAAQKAGENLFRVLTQFEFLEPEDCVAPDVPEVIASQAQAEAFNQQVLSFQNCLIANQQRDAGAYSAVIGVLGYQMDPDSFAMSEPEDTAFSGAVMLACEMLASEPGQCSAALSAIAKAYGERIQGVNHQFAQFQENTRHLYAQ